MARLFGLIGTLVLSGAQATTFTQECNTAWAVAENHGCLDSYYEKSVVCDGACQGHLEGVGEGCNGTDRGHHAKILGDYCQDPYSRDCYEAYEIFDHVGCKSGFAGMCKWRCQPYMEQMSMNCTSETVMEEDGSMSNLKEFSSMMLGSCSDECFIEYSMLSDCLSFYSSGPTVCHHECTGYMAALQEERCASQTVPKPSDPSNPSGNHSVTYGEFAAQIEVTCHPCWMLYHDAVHMYDCGSNFGDCAHCLSVVDQMYAEPRCTGEGEMLAEGYSYLDLIFSLEYDIDSACQPPQRKCHTISEEAFKKFGALHCHEGL